MATTVAHYRLSHTCIMNITPHVCKGLEAIWAYTACAPLAWLAARHVLINTWSLSFQDTDNFK